MSLIIPANSASAGGYAVDNSLRFDSTAGTYLNFNQATATSARKMTYSTWFKLSKLNDYNILLENVANPHISQIVIQDNGNNNDLRFYDYDGSTNIELKTSRAFRDVSAWYHIVVAMDTTQSTASNRVKIYINGVQETALDTATYPDQNYDTAITGGTLQIGRQGTTSYYLDGYLAETVFIDGLQLAADSFGEFDEDSGIWKPIDGLADLTFGNNGFYLDYKDSSALGNDAAGSNNLTVNNLTAVDQSTDTCTNNSATFNPLFTPNPSNVSTFSEGNLKVVTNSTSQNSEGLSTLGLTTGKWYGEFKLIAQAAGESLCGVLNNIENVTSSGLNGTGGFSVASNGDSFNNGSSQGAGNFSASYTTNDIIGIALDLDNNRVYFSKNGSYTDGSGNFDESSPTGYFSLTSGQTYFMGVGDKSTSQSSTWEANFGSPSFAISSGNTDANDYGNFEYAVPSGYYALNTKNLAEFG